jgi:hypothetical protein
MFMLSVKVSKFSLTFTLGISIDSAPYPISGVLRDRRQSKNKNLISPDFLALRLASKSHNSQNAYRIEVC